MRPTAMRFVFMLVDKVYKENCNLVNMVALVVFLSHIGSFVPADAATVGLTDRIFCAMGSKFMTAEQSTFMIDLHQVGLMLRQATPKSLCLLDEFGKGTLTGDGVGLLGGTINHFANCENPPKFYTMSVLRPDDNCRNVKDITFLYRVALCSTCSNDHIQRLCNEKILAKDQLYKVCKTPFIEESNSNGLLDVAKYNPVFISCKDAVDKLLAFDACKGDLDLFFQDIFPSEL
ncbi:MutS protein msh5 [Asimina triloba]